MRTRKSFEEEENHAMTSLSISENLCPPKILLRKNHPVPVTSDLSRNPGSLLGSPQLRIQ